MVKPDATAKGNTGAIINDIIAGGFAIKAMKWLKPNPKNKQANFMQFIAKDLFMASLVDFMSSGPIVAAILEKENAVADFRTLIGATNPAQAAEGTIRKKYAASIGENAVHGSDSDENAAIEGDFFFSKLERF